MRVPPSSLAVPSHRVSGKPRPKASSRIVVPGEPDPSPLLTALSDAALDQARGMMGLRMPPAAELCAPHSTSERGLKRAYASELAMRRRQHKGRTLASLVGSDPARLVA